jgi:peptide deformylase
MAVLPIVRFPDPLLKRPTRSVGRVDDRARRLIRDMILTMRHHPRCVGLAAPQVGSDLRIAVMDSSAHPKAANTSGLLVLVNPVLERSEDAVFQREGCLSVPDFTGNVRRASRVCVRALDERGQSWQRWLEGFEAIIAQHEVDHLGGTLFLDRVVNVTTDLFTRKTYL